MKKISLKEKIMLGAVLLVATPSIIPSIVSAQGLRATNLSQLIGGFIGLIKQAIPLVIALTVLVFLWGVFKLVLSGDSEEKRNEAKNIMFYGIVSLFVMVSVWGLVKLLTLTFFGSGEFLLPQLRSSK